MTVHTLQVNMTRGEITPYAHGRVENELYQAGLYTARNFLVLRYGGVIRCPGTLYQGPLRYNTTRARTLKFEFNREQVYAIEAGSGYFRFWTRDGRIESPPGTPVTVVTPYTNTDLRYIQTRQSGDVLYVFCRGFQPRVLRRNSETSWTLELYEPLDGPYLDLNVTATTLTPSSYNSFGPAMTGLTAPSGTVSSDNAVATAWTVFDKEGKTFATLASGSEAWVQYQLASGSKIVNAYWLQAPPQPINSADMPTQWEVQGSNDGATWVTLDIREGVGSWSGAEKRFYEFTNEVAYSYLRLDATGGGGEDGTNISVAEWGPNEAGNSQTPTLWTFSSTTGINGGAGLTSLDEGRAISVIGSDGKRRWIKITSVSTNTTFYGRTYGHAFPNLQPLGGWRLGAWSDYTGWPSSVAIYEDRLVAARTDADPLGVWASVNADYDNFRTSTPGVDDDGVALRLTGGSLNDISWLNESKEIVAGTAGSLRTIGRNNSNAAFSASNARQKTETITPSSVTEPISIENVLLFMDLFEQRLYEAAYTYEVEGYLAREVSTLSEHLFAIGVDKIAYMSHPHKIIWARRLDGKLVAFTYDREQKVAGATLVDVGGYVDDVETLPGDTGTDVWLMVQRTVGGTTQRYYERLAEFWRQEFSTQDAPVYAASALTYIGSSVNTLSGLSHLAGLTVGVWGNGRDLGDYVVSGAGVVTLPSGVFVSNAAIGLRMPARIQTLRLAQIGNQDGAGLGRKVNIVGAQVDLFETAGITVGTLSQVDVLRFEDEAEEDPGLPVTLRTGMFPLTTDDSWSNNGVLVLTTDRLYPATIRGFEIQVDGEP